MDLDDDAQQFVWAVLTAALKVDPLLKSGTTAQRLESLCRAHFEAILDATDAIVRTVESLKQEAGVPSVEQSKPVDPRNPFRRARGLPEIELEAQSDS